MSEWVYEDACVCDCLLPAHRLKEVESAQLTDGNSTHVSKECGVCTLFLDGNTNQCAKSPKPAEFQHRQTEESEKKTHMTPKRNFQDMEKWNGDLKEEH